jgi:hypothetical protein
MMLVSELDTHLSGVTGMTLVDHLHFGAIQNDLTAEEAEEIFVDVRKAVRGLMTQ